MQAMKKFNTKVVSLKRRQVIVQRAQVKLNTNLARVSNEMARNSPNPAEVDAVKTKVIDWMTRYENIVDQVTPYEDKRNMEVMDALDDKMEANEDTVEGMFEDWEENDEQFWEEVVKAQDDMLATWETQGTTDKMDKLATEIDDSLRAAHNSMIKIKSNLSMRKKIFTQSLS